MQVLSVGAVGEPPFGYAEAWNAVAHPLPTHAVVELSMHEPELDDRSLWDAAIGDGRRLLMFTALCLLLAGGFALFQSATGHFLPHDSAYLGMSAQDLCSMHECRIVHFMIHDRVSFGGALIAIGMLYLWLAEFPLRRGKAWSWWVFVVSGVVGFASFLAYLGYGYLDSWHGTATLVLLPTYVGGIVRSRRQLKEPSPLRSLLQPSAPISVRTTFGVGRICLLAASIGVIGAGLTIMFVGMTTVFVPQDLEPIREPLPLEG